MAVHSSPSDLRLMATVDALSQDANLLRLALLGRFHDGSQWEHAAARLIADLQEQVTVLTRQFGVLQEETAAHEWRS